MGIVCDGMGGARAGSIASTMAVDAFCRVLAREKAVWASQPQAVLTAAAEEANHLILSRGLSDPDCQGMGTTLVAALLLRDHVHIINIGDSRAYHITDEGIRRITRDHSVVEDLVLRGELTPEQARQHPQKNLITRALAQRNSCAWMSTSCLSERASFCCFARTDCPTWSPTRKSCMKLFMAARSTVAATDCWTSPCPGERPTM